MKGSKHIKSKSSDNSKAITQEEFEIMIKEAEKGPFKEHTDFETFKKDILTLWKKKYGK